MAKTFTFEFTYDNDLDGFGFTAFNATTLAEAQKLFEAFSEEEGFKADDYSVEPVFNFEDSMIYDDYGTPEEYNKLIESAEKIQKVMAKNAPYEVDESTSVFDIADTINTDPTHFINYLSELIMDM